MMTLPVNTLNLIDTFKNKIGDISDNKIIFGFRKAKRKRKKSNIIGLYDNPNYGWFKSRKKSMFSTKGKRIIGLKRKSSWFKW